jgi:hypothetical protein
MSLPNREAQQLLQTWDKTPLEEFEPNIGGQDIAARSDAHELIVSGGNSTGKSLLGIVKGCHHTIPEKDIHGTMTGKTIHPYLDIRIPADGVEGWISTWSQDSQRDTLRPLIDKYMTPYFVKPPVIEDGVYKRMFFEGKGWVNMKWQTQKLSAYRGPKKNWIFMDEPHQEQIYKEVRSRLFRSGGYMWICMTPIVNPEDPQKSEDVLWMRREIIEPYERNPEDFPLRKVVYIDVEENYQYVDLEFIDGMLAGMSDMERRVRKSGSFLLFTGRKCFDMDMILTLQSYLMEHPEESTCEYGELEYDVSEDDDTWKVQFRPSKLEYFSDHPKGEYVIKVWERPVPADGMQHSPGYTIAVDVAEGKPGGDRDDNRRIVASLHGHLSEEKLAKELWLLGNYYNDNDPNFRPALLAIEVRPAGPGSTCQKMLLTGNPALNIPKYPGDRFYYRPTTTDVERGKKFGYAPGWDTNSKTRQFVITAMREALIRAYSAIMSGKHCTIPDMGCLNEADGFGMNKQGKYVGNPA